MNTPPDPLLSMTVSTGITRQTIASWQLFVPRDPRVLVPIQLDVLMVRKAGGAWADCGMRVPKDDGTMLDAGTMLPPPFSELQKTRPTGAYLHWALPDALNAGKQDGATATFPAIPDRWLVLRIYPSKTTPDRRTIRGWVLKSGLQVPTVTDLPNWVEDGQTSDGKKPLTPLGHGDLAWQAYYDNVANRLGFYDSLSDVTNGPVAYVVCGWYADTTLDPLSDSNIRSLADFDAKMHEFGWGLDPKNYQEAVKKRTQYVMANEAIGLSTRLSTVEQSRRTLALDPKAFQRQEPGATPAGPPYVTDGSWWPQNSLFHGSCLGIGWPGLGWDGNPNGLLSGEVASVPKPEKINVAVGETITEAMAALVGNATGSNKEARMLEAFQLGVLAELDEADGQARLDSALQTAAFGSIPGGSATERVWQPPSGPPPISPASDAQLDPGKFSRYQFANQKSTPSRVKSAPFKRASQGPVNPKVFQAASYLQETDVVFGGLGDAIFQVQPSPLEPYVPGKWVDAQRSLPRFFHPMDPVVLLQGANRSFKYGSNDRFSADGTLQCRLTGTCLHEYVAWHGEFPLPPVYPDDVLDRGVENGSVPPECDEILGEAAILDPGASAPIVNSASKSVPIPAAQLAAQVQNVMVDQTAWLVTRDPRIDRAPVVSRSAYTGILPSPISIGLPNIPWNPVHLDWSIQFIPSAGGINDWHLGESDYDESLPKLPSAQPPNPITLQGRAPLHDGAADIAAKAVQQALDQMSRVAGAGPLPSGHFTERHPSALSQMLLQVAGQLQVDAQNVPDADRAALEDIATTLKSMDVLASSMNILTLLRGGYPGDGTAAPQPGDPAPAMFFPMRAGFIKILRLRLVDGFGQFVDLAGSSAAQTADPKRILHSEPLDVTGHPELLALPPRFTSPARILLRFMDAAGSQNEAALATDVSPGYSPVCGYLMPNHLEAALEFFRDDGSNAGIVRPADDGSILWEDAPGQPSTVGQSPSRALPNRYLTAVADSLIRWGIRDAGLLPGNDTALQALLRVIDSTLWSVDPFGHQGDEHLSLLVGHPVVVMRASLKMEIQEPVNPDSALKIRFPVRLGALSHWQDGLLGYFVNDDYNTLFCSDASAAGLARSIGPGVGFLQQANLVQGYYDSFSSPAANDPVTHPYVDTSGTIWLYPGQEVQLTLLVEPMTNVSATTGLLPRKQVGMRREWVNDALAKIAPTFRFGPVLVDPKNIRMPIAAELNGTWTWDHRTDVITWASDPVTHANQDARLQPDAPIASEGWLQLNPPEPGAKK
jgi:hypothetical protein